MSGNGTEADKKETSATGDIIGKRRELDKIDAEIARLFSERFDICREIGTRKRESGAPVSDGAREKEIIERVRSASGDYGFALCTLYRSVLSYSRSLQRVYGLVGEDIAGSLSPQIHAMLGHPGYCLFELAPCETRTFFTGDAFDGVNVTMPYKRTAYGYCDILSENARRTGCVNTVVRCADGGLYGDNTDLFGFSYMLQRSGIDACGAKVLLIGNGGAAACARAVLADAGAREIVTVSRSVGCGLLAIGDNTDADIIVNATPLRAGLPVEFDRFANLRGVVDVVYHETELCREAGRRNVAYTGGIAMLVAQAAASRGVFLAAAEGTPGKTVEVDFDEIESIISHLSGACAV